MTRPPLGILGLIGGSLRLLASRFGTLFPLAFALSLAISGASYLVAGAPPAPEAAATTGMILLLAAQGVAGFVVTGVMCLAGLDAALGTRHSARDYLSQTLRHLPAVCGIGLLISIATAIGLVLFVAPALYVTARYLPWAPAVLFENRGWGGLRRAEALTEGFRWPLAAACLGVGAIFLGGAILVSPLIAAAFAAGPIGIAVEAAVSALGFALVAAFTALAYLRLRDLNEGTDAAEVARSIG